MKRAHELDERVLLEKEVCCAALLNRGKRVGVCGLLGLIGRSGKRRESREGWKVTKKGWRKEQKRMTK